MKKVFSFLFIALLSLSLVGCTFSLASSKDEDKKQERTCEYLIDTYIKVWNDEKPELLKEVFPEFFVKRFEDGLTVENLKKSKERYGKNTKMTYKITNKTKMDDEWIERANSDLKEYYQTDMQVKECYEIEGTVTTKGSEKEEVNNMNEFYYCDFDGTWYLIFG